MKFGPGALVKNKTLLQMSDNDVMTAKYDVLLI